VLKAMMLSAMIAGEPEMASPKSHKKLKNLAISTAVIVVANLLVYSPIIMANLSKEE
jgi:hypothetical protein